MRRLTLIARLVELRSSSYACRLVLPSVWVSYFAEALTFCRRSHIMTTDISMTFVMPGDIQSTQLSYVFTRPDPARPQSLDMIINTLESSAAAKSSVGGQDRDTPGEGMRQLAVKLRRKLDKTPPRWQVFIGVKPTAPACPSACAIMPLWTPRYQGYAVPFVLLLLCLFDHTYVCSISLPSVFWHLRPIPEPRPGVHHVRMHRISRSQLRSQRNITRLMPATFLCNNLRMYLP